MCIVAECNRPASVVRVRKVAERNLERRREHLSKLTPTPKTCQKVNPRHPFCFQGHRGPLRTRLTFRTTLANPSRSTAGLQLLGPAIRQQISLPGLHSPPVLISFSRRGLAPPLLAVPLGLPGRHLERQAVPGRPHLLLVGQQPFIAQHVPDLPRGTPTFEGPPQPARA